MRRSLRPGARVLVRLPAWLGDHVAAEPIVRALLSGGARVTAVGPARFAPLLPPHDALTHVALERGATPDPRRWRGHDVALLLDGSTRGAFAAWRAGIPERAGFSNVARAPFLTHAVAPAFERGGVAFGLGVSGAWPRRLPRPFAAAAVELAHTCGLVVEDRRPRVHVESRARDELARRLEASGLARGERVLVLHAGSRARSPKGLPPKLATALAAPLARADGARVVVPFAPGEEVPARAAVELLRAELGSDRVLALDTPPLTVPELAALHEHAARVVTPDSGARHLAQALTNAPILVVCGPTDPRHTAEHGLNVRVARVRVPCGPCHAEPCPIVGSEAHACMTRIDAGAVAVEFLAATRGG